MNDLLKIKNVRNITVNDLSNNYKMIYINKFQSAFTEDLINPTKTDTKSKKKVRKTKEELCKEIGLSDTTLKRYMKDLGMNSFYRHNHNKTYVKSKNTKKDDKEDIVETTEKKKKSKPKKIKNNDKDDKEEYDYNETFDKTIDGLKIRK